MVDTTLKHFVYLCVVPGDKLTKMFGEALHFWVVSVSANLNVFEDFVDIEMLGDEAFLV